MKTLIKKNFYKLTLERFPGAYRPNSLPYISGDTFRKFSNHIFDETRSFNPKKVKNNEIIFLNSELIEIFFSIHDPKITSKYILISHNSDKSPSREELNLISENVIHWFVQNLEFNNNSRISFLPIGLENKRWLKNGIFRNTTDSDFKSKLVLSSFNVYNNYSVRKMVLDIANTNKNVENKKFSNSKKYFKELKQYKFILCPPGNGPDTHRIWESLMYKTFPIFELNSFTNNLKNLGVPALYLNSWSDLGSISDKDLKLEYKKLSNLNSDMIYFDFWDNQFKSKLL
tara:strand:+ start:1197 stop:2054 length:858 start_codon:yes stop_codon:yes gene_type:complete